MNFEEFSGEIAVVRNNIETIASDPDFINELTKPVMIMDPDGELLHFKTIEYSVEHGCWVIYSES